MKHKILSKIITILLFGLILTFTGRMTITNESKMSREAYVARKVATYDKIQSHQFQIVAFALEGVGICGVLFVLYEGIAFGLLKLLDAGDKKVQNRDHVV